MSCPIQLSIIIPYYNSNAWIGAMLDSLLDQDIPKERYEIIVVDDGSSENPLRLLQYASSHSNITYIRQENGGLSAARNHGLSKSRGKWVFFCDSDDYIQRKVLRELLDIAEERDLEMLLFDYVILKPDEEPNNPRRDFSSVTETQTMKNYLASYVSNPMSFGFGACRYLIRKRVLTEYSIRFENLAYVEDRIFQLRLIPVVQRIAHVDVDLYFYIQRKSSILHAKKRKNYSQYAPWLWYYLEELYTMIQRPDLPDDTKRVLIGWRDMGAFSLLINTMKYCSLSTSYSCLDKLLSVNVFPLEVKGSTVVRIIRKCMNHPALWKALCGIYQIFPRSIRLLF